MHAGVLARFSSSRCLPHSSAPLAHHVMFFTWKGAAGVARLRVEWDRREASLSSERAAAVAHPLERSIRAGARIAGSCGGLCCTLTTLSLRDLASARKGPSWGWVVCFFEEGSRTVATSSTGLPWCSLSAVMDRGYALMRGGWYSERTFVGVPIVRLKTGHVHKATGSWCHVGSDGTVFCPSRWAGGRPSLPWRSPPLLGKARRHREGRRCRFRCGQ